MFRFVSTMIFAMAFSGAASAQVNLLVNGGLDDNWGYGGAPFSNTFNSGLFRGFQGWRTELVDDGMLNSSYTLAPTYPGGHLFLNTYGQDITNPPNGNGTAPRPVLTGYGSAVLLGPFDGRATTSGLWQQVAVNPGSTYRITSFVISDPAQVDNNGASLSIYAQSFANKSRMKLEYVNAAGGRTNTGDVSLTIHDAFLDTQAQIDAKDGKWIETVIETTAPEGSAFARTVLDFVQNATDPGLVHADNVSVVNLTAGAPLVGDFDYDGTFDADDLILLRQTAAGKIIPATNRFDLNNSGAVNSADITAWLALLPAGGIPGDYNDNGAVDAADYTIWRDTDGGATDLRADDNHTGSRTLPAAGNVFRAVDLADNRVWRENFGLAAGPSASAAVPEPATWLLATLITCCGFAYGHSEALRLSQ